ncbi:hypothetical protein GYMLUDRAFT_57867 [Collybiopsis luxurians FD-317 M1]|uniref:Uncharacterized protein n=1 Tax=Collybiopsis luxurians FD-317 M1 TaxID=944289 RepID=A0A0D0CUD8_9AGAR|nr:hypothetical protein GYMLUDRAFT_57867 [Collybiopsis luxurians FD-317 M1]
MSAEQVIGAVDDNGLTVTNGPENDNNENTALPESNVAFKPEEGGEMSSLNGEVEGNFSHDASDISAEAELQTDGQEVSENGIKENGTLLSAEAGMNGNNDSAERDENGVIEVSEVLPDDAETLPQGQTAIIASEDSFDNSTGRHPENFVEATQPVSVEEVEAVDDPSDSTPPETELSVTLGPTDTALEAQEMFITQDPGTKDTIEEPTADDASTEDRSLEVENVEESTGMSEAKDAVSASSEDFMAETPLDVSSGSQEELHVDAGDAQSQTNEKDGENEIASAEPPSISSEAVEAVPQKDVAADDSPLPDTSVVDQTTVAEERVDLPVAEDAAVIESGSAPDVVATDVSNGEPATIEDDFSVTAGETQLKEEHAADEFVSRSEEHEQHPGTDQAISADEALAFSEADGVTTEEQTLTRLGEEVAIGHDDISSADEMFVASEAPSLNTTSGEELPHVVDAENTINAPALVGTDEPVLAEEASLTAGNDEVSVDLSSPDELVASEAPNSNTTSGEELPPVIDAENIINAPAFVETDEPVPVEEAPLTVGNDEVSVDLTASNEFVASEVPSSESTSGEELLPVIDAENIINTPAFVEIDEPVPVEEVPLTAGDDEVSVDLTSPDESSEKLQVGVSIDESATLLENTSDTGASEPNEVPADRDTTVTEISDASSAFVDDSAEEFVEEVSPEHAAAEEVRQESGTANSHADIAAIKVESNEQSGDDEGDFSEPVETQDYEETASNTQSSIAGEAEEAKATSDPVVSVDFEAAEQTSSSDIEESSAHVSPIMAASELPKDDDVAFQTSAPVGHTLELQAVSASELKALTPSEEIEASEETEPKEKPSESLAEVASHPELSVGSSPSEENTITEESTNFDQPAARPADLSSELPEDVVTAQQPDSTLEGVDLVNHPEPSSNESEAGPQPSMTSESEGAEAPEVAGDAGTTAAEEISKLTVDAVEFERPKSPWTPSYSVINQGPSVVADEDIPEIKQLPPSDTPAVRVTTDEIAVIDANSGESTESQQLPQPSSPWVASYSVSVQGSPSASARNSPALTPSQLPENGEVVNQASAPHDQTKEPEAVATENEAELETSSASDDTAALRDEKVVPPEAADSSMVVEEAVNAELSQDPVYASSETMEDDVIAQQSDSTLETAKSVEQPELIMKEDELRTDPSLIGDPKEVEATHDPVGDASETVTEDSSSLTVDIDAKGEFKSLWSPSYSSASQSHSVGVEEGVPENVQLFSIAPSGGSLAPTVQITAEEPEVAHVNPPRESEESAESAQTSSSWVPSYSVSVQGSPSVSAHASPSPNVRELPDDTEAVAAPTESVQEEPESISADDKVEREALTASDETAVSDSEGAKGDLVESTVEPPVDSAISEDVIRAELAQPPEVLENVAYDSADDAVIAQEADQISETTEHIEHLTPDGSELQRFNNTQEVEVIVEPAGNVAAEKIQTEDASLLDVDVVEIERPRSPWTPSYSITSHGPGTGTEDFPENNRVSPSDAPAHAESQSPVVTVTTDGAETVDPVESENSEQPPRPSSPWVPSYSVSVQGSPSVSAPASPILAASKVPMDEDISAHKPSLELDAVPASIKTETEIDAPTTSDEAALPREEVKQEDSVESDLQADSQSEIPVDLENDSRSLDRPLETRASPPPYDSTENVIFAQNLDRSGPSTDEPLVNAEVNDQSVREHDNKKVKDVQDVPIENASFEASSVEPDKTADVDGATLETLSPSVAAEIERPKSPWGSYEVMTQSGSKTPVNEPDVTEDAAQYIPAQTSFISNEPTVLSSLREPVLEGKSETEESLSADKSKLTLGIEDTDLPERPKSPWSPSYSVTKQGSRIFDERKDGAEAAKLEQLAPRAETPVDAPAEIPASGAENTENTAGETFPATQDSEDQDTVGNTLSVNKDRKRLESTTSSLFFPGGWFSKAPAGRASLDNAQGEITSPKAMSPVEGPSSAGLQYLSSAPSPSSAEAEETNADVDDKTKKGKWCILM